MDGFSQICLLQKTVQKQEEKSLDKNLFLEEIETEEEDPKMKTTMRAFSQLGEECKNLLTLFYFEKKSLNDIASFLKIGAASARNKKYRCMQRLRQLAQQQ